MNERYATLASESERHRFGELLVESFAAQQSDIPNWFANAGAEHLRGYFRGAEQVGGLIHVPMGQFYGGRSLRMGGIAGVVTSPVARGTGSATRMMRAALGELRKSGYPLSALYPATQTVYRRVGYEQAGARFELQSELVHAPEGDRALAMRAFVPSDLPAVQRLYAEQARRRAGWVDRGSYIWNRIQRPRGVQASGYVVEAGGQLAGYVFFTRVPKASLRHQLVLTDWMARDAAAWRRLLCFLKDHDSLGDGMTWHGGPDEPLLLLWKEQQVKVQLLDYWCLRILDVEAALVGRGYPRGLSGSLTLAVEDPLFPENARRYGLHVQGGAGHVTDGSDGGLRLGINALATLYAGHRSASELAALGWVEGTPDALETADALFSGPTPSMRDMF